MARVAPEKTILHRPAIYVSVKSTYEVRLKMATLTLKKPKLIGETPLENLSGKFVVMRQSRHVKSFRFTCIHDSYDLAMREAKRLTKANNTERYLVLEVAGWADFPLLGE